MNIQNHFWRKNRNEEIKIILIAWEFLEVPYCIPVGAIGKNLIQCWDTALVYTFVECGKSIFTHIMLGTIKGVFYEKHN